ELVGRTELPAVEGEFKVAHEVFATEDGMFLHPDNALAEVQVMGLQHGRVTGAVAVAAPNIKSPTRQQDASQVTEPGMQQAVELLVGMVIIGQHAVFGTQLRSR